MYALQLTAALHGAASRLPAALVQEGDQLAPVVAGAGNFSQGRVVPDAPHP